MRTLLATLLLVLTLATAALTDTWVAVRVNPTVQLVPPYGSGAVRISVTIPKDAGNRALCFGYDGTAFRASCLEYRGTKAPSVLQWVFTGLPKGEYVAFAEVVRVGVDGKARSQVASVGFTLQ